MSDQYVTKADPANALNEFRAHLDTGLRVVVDQLRGAGESALDLDPADYQLHSGESAIDYNPPPQWDWAEPDAYSADDLESAFPLVDIPDWAKTTPSDARETGPLPELPAISATTTGKLPKLPYHQLPRFNSDTPVMCAIHELNQRCGKMSAGDLAVLVGDVGRGEVHFIALSKPKLRDTQSRAPYLVFARKLILSMLLRMLGDQLTLHDAARMLGYSDNNGLSYARMTIGQPGTALGTFLEDVMTGVGKRYARIAPRPKVDVDTSTLHDLRERIGKWAGCPRERVQASVKSFTPAADYRSAMAYCLTRMGWMADDIAIECFYSPNSSPFTPIDRAIKRLTSEQRNQLDTLLHDAWLLPLTGAR